MNFYSIDFEEQDQQEFVQEPLLQQQEQIMYYDYEQSEQNEPEQLNTFDGYLQEEPVLLFNFAEEAPKKKSRLINRKSKKVKKADSETEASQSNRSKPRITNRDYLKLQQCQRLKIIITQMESLLQQTRTQIFNKYMQNRSN
ncbi:unnamed protein product (macronuclear) [Paramecium tetraurelia]|uniref:BZIP domain-containing protein n=1 Tax=Paramecium tetraurelia TaxID=5888 RepID=A0CWU4_PARTE|nr:uncharacterized protein GSPATT00001464001 [Paramecium tetraurelia]CAK75261.1 unnamed protein product [Paramecium tetraurelia]|eukprot:XP_001442658.1 hypothetical protein (macronuclear) [Paramecium tetraurelia strain d4-2]